MFGLFVQPKSLTLTHSAQRIFQYLTSYFLDFDPIKDPRAKKLTTSANEAERVSTATEHAQNSQNTLKHGQNSRRWRSHKRDNNEDLSTKALTRGTQDVNDRNVRRTQDPCTKAEASAQGTSAECAEMTTVVLESTPHEAQDWLHSSLPLTLRLPIDGKPIRCKQEAADSAMTAEHTNGMDADVDGKAMLGRELAGMVHRVNEGGEECEPQVQLQQMKFYCEESCQCSENATENIPSAHGLLLEGEWVICASGEMENPNRHGNESSTMLNASIMIPECTDGLGESRETEDTVGVESESCERGAVERASVDEVEEVDQVPTKCCQQLGTADGDPS